jgi:pimeloyl-ACP methyl ester carboxylesterase
MFKSFIVKFSIFIIFASFLYSQQSIYVETDDGWKIHSKYVKPKKDNLPVLLLIHSAKSNHLEFKKWFYEIEVYGYGWLASDLRGHGASIYHLDGTSETYKTFSISGINNDYNKMIRDIDACVIYLSSTGVDESRIFLVGINLGANIAIKYAAINQKIKGIVAINPASNINDITTINPLMLYKEKPILFITGQNFQKRMREVFVLYNLTKRKNGTNYTFIITEYSITSADAFTRTQIHRILNWIKYPVMPNVIEPEKYKTQISSDTIFISTPSSKPAVIVIDEDEK